VVWCYVTLCLKYAVTIKFLCDGIELKIELNEEFKILTLSVCLNNCRSIQEGYNFLEKLLK